MQPGHPSLALNDALAIDALAAQFAAEGRVQIRSFLRDADAARLRDHLLAREDWHLVLNSGEKLFELDAAAQRSLDPARRAALDQAVFDAARTGFQFRYRTIRLPDHEHARGQRGTVLDAFAALMSSPGVIAVLRRITGCADVDFADAQATAYGPGHFLTAHDDAVAGKQRRAAYVFGLTPAWRIDWGGLLLFHDAGGVVRGHAPDFNALSLFAVPQPHNVTLVSPAAPFDRLSVTGWLRTRDAEAGFHGVQPGRIAVSPGAVGG